MYDIKIIVAGIILLTGSSMYDGVVDPSAPFESAIAVDAASARVGSYDVDIPAHNAKIQLDVLHDTVPSFGGIMTLNHHRIYFGKKASGNCVQLPTGASLGASALNIPRLSQIMKTAPVLRDDARPKAGDFKPLATGPVAGWLELPRGTLQAPHSPSRMDEVVEFRPSERVAVLASQVFLTLPAGSIDCMVVTPFGGSAVTYDIQDPSFTVTMLNMAAPDTGQAVPGIGYDFELLYDLFKRKDPVPPVPYSLSPAKTTPSNTMPMGEINTQTGVNCGPPGH